MPKDQKKLLFQIQNLIHQSHQQFDINQDQTGQRVLFDALVAINNSSQILNKAWKLGQKNKLDLDFLRSDFIDTFSEFAQVKKSLKSQFKTKH